MMISNQKSLLISVIGGSDPGPKALKQAEQVGQELAKRGVVVVCGGLSGVMEAVCKGAKKAGGTTIGILPGSEPDSANPYVDIPLCTDLGYARNFLVVKAGRAAIAIDGAFGTMSEIGHALAANIPVIGLNTWAFSINGKQIKSIIIAENPVDAVEIAIKEARSRDEKCKEITRTK